MKKSVVVMLILGIVAIAGFSKMAFSEDETCSMGMKASMHEKMVGGMHGKMMGSMRDGKGMNRRMDLEQMFNHKERLIMDNAVELGLSDDQIEKIKTLTSSTNKAGIKSDADIEVLAIDIEEALGKDDVNANGVNALMEKKYDLKLQAAKTLVSAYADLKKVLTKAQMDKLHNIWKAEKMEKRDNMEKGKGMMMNMKN